MRTKPTKLVFASLIVIAVVRIASTYTIFSLTTDEPVHVGAGLELLQRHTYTLQPVNPPLPRVILALGPSLHGVRIGPPSEFYAALQNVYSGAGQYRTNLVLMRVGNLVFFVLSAVALFVWTRRELGDAEAVLATFFFTFQPVILGYSGIANHDVPGTAGFAVAVLAFSAWLRKPDAIHASWLGAAYGFSILCKFSNIPYVAVACGLMFIAHAIRDAQLRRIRTIATLLLVPFVAFGVIWAGYAFTFGPIHSMGPSSRFRVPAPAFFEGIEQLVAFDRCCFTSYAFGRTTLHGWWWYFPAAIGLKTTLPFLALFFIGAWFAWRSPSIRWRFLDGVLAALGVLIVSMPTTLDLGIRYVLPIYIPLAFATAAGTAEMLRHARIDVRRFAIALVAIEVVISAAAHPDYFPYFNALAGDEPGWFLVDSNLDWGQDVLRLKGEVRRRHIERLGVILAANPDFDALGMPPTYPLDPFRPERGWLAIGEHFYRIQRLDKGWWWLEPYRYTRVGKSIRLYFIPACEPRPGEGLNERPTTDRILLPIAGTLKPWGVPGLAQWTVDQTIRNHGTKPVHVTLDQCATKPCDFDVAANASVRIAGAEPVRPFIWLTVPRGAADSLELTTIARRVDRRIPSAEVHVPAVPESEFRAGEVVIENVPFSPAQRLNLRLYSTIAQGSQATVRISDGTNVVAEATVPIYSTGFYTHGDFQAFVPSLSNRTFTGTLSIRANRRIWAFVTATELATGRTRVFLPRTQGQ